MDMIDLMPPGLYEAVITEVDENTENPELVQGKYLFRLEARTLDDIRALGGNDAEDDLRFATAARVSEVNHGLYQTLCRPGSARDGDRAGAPSRCARMHPNRLRFEVFSDENPLMRPVAGVGRAGARRSPPGQRRTIRSWPSSSMASDMITSWLEIWGKARDAATEAFFLNTYGSPLLQALVGLGADSTAVTPPHRSAIWRERRRAKTAAAHLEQQIRAGRTDRGGRARADLCAPAGGQGRRARIRRC